MINSQLTTFSYTCSCATFDEARGVHLKLRLGIHVSAF